MPNGDDRTPFLLAPVLVKLGISQRKLARMLDVPQTHVRRFHSGKYLPSWPSACAIARALGVSVGVFAEGDPAHSEMFHSKVGAS